MQLFHFKISEQRTGIQSRFYRNPIILNLINVSIYLIFWHKQKDELQKVFFITPKKNISKQKLKNNVK